MKKNKGGGEGTEWEKKKRRGKMGMGKVGRGGARGRAEEKEDIEERLGKLYCKWICLDKIYKDSNLGKYLPT